MDDDVFSQIVNNHSDYVHEREEVDEEYANAPRFVRDAEEESLKSEKKELGKKEVSKKRRNAAIITVLIVASLALGAKTNDMITDRNNVVISTQGEVKNDVHEKIVAYERAIGIYAERKDIQFEFPTGRNPKNDELLVDYNPHALVRAIEEASLVGEEDVRCVINAAYNITNQGYKEEELNKTFELLAKDENLSSDYSWLRGGSLESYLNEIGFSTLDEYDKGEKAKIREIAAINKYVNESGVGRHG